MKERIELGSRMNSETKKFVGRFIGNIRGYYQDEIIHWTKIANIIELSPQREEDIYQALLDFMWRIKVVESLPKEINHMLVTGDELGLPFFLRNQFLTVDPEDIVETRYKIIDARGHPVERLDYLRGQVGVVTYVFRGRQIGLKMRYGEIDSLIPTNIATDGCLVPIFSR